MMPSIRATITGNVSDVYNFPQGGLAYVSLWGLANPRSRSQGGPSGQASRLRESPMYTAGKVAESVRPLSTVTLSLRGLG